MLSILRLTIISLLILVAGAAFGQWSADPAVNLALGDGDGDQVVPHISINPDNSIYTGWYDTKSGNYDVALQLVSADGTELWPHDGIIVSAHAQNSWVMDWALISDSAGNAIVAFADIRDGNSNIHVYKISPDGSFLWGADGIDITNNNDGKGPPALVETNDGDIVVAWSSSPTMTPPAIRVQRLTADGTAMFGSNGISASQVIDTMPAGPAMVPSGDDGFILAYVPIYSFMGNRQIKVQRYTGLCEPLWMNYKMIMDDDTLPMGHYFEMMSDGNSGAFFSFSVAMSTAFEVRAQHISGASTESFMDNGVPVSSSSAYSQISPGMAYDAATSELTVLYVQMTSSQNEKGVFCQRISSNGDLLWGATVLEILPVNTTNEGFVRAVDTGDGVIGLCFQAPQNAYGQDEIIGFKLDADGAFLWDPSPVGVCTLPSSKDDLIAIGGNDGAVRAIWADQRNGGYDIYGQNLNGDGSLGVSLAPAQGPTPTLIQLSQNHPNPFNPSTDIAFSLPSRQHVVLQIFDTRGHIVRTLLDAEAGPGPQTVRWNGHNSTGSAVPSGMYFYSLESADERQVRKMVLIK